MKMIRVTFLLCEILILLLLLTPTYSQGLNEKMVTKVFSRKLMIISSEHVNVMASTTTVHEDSTPRLPVTSSGKSENEDKKSEEEEKNTLSKYLSMDYPKFRRRRPVHNKSLPRTP